MVQGGSVALLDPYQTLSSAQRELQRKSTLQLLHHALQISESEAELHDTLAHIQELNSTQVVLNTTQAGDQELEEDQGGLGRCRSSQAGHGSMSLQPHTVLYVTIPVYGRTEHG
ncbi:HMG domain-containing protein 3 [Oncorhynchus keta]|uniref:HMG domain-containing protein 3 n=1 Tax=Oncorhynchus keta TaxID=8018 RepID=UPI0015FA2560|nr:HMG domain-containing protein 3 [Oncorhynchus keta]